MLQDDKPTILNAVVAQSTAPLDVSVVTTLDTSSMHSLDRPMRADLKHDFCGWFDKNALAFAQSMAAYTLPGDVVVECLPQVFRERLLVLSSSLLQEPIGKMGVKESCGRVFWLAFEGQPAPRAQVYDPELPIFFGEMSRTLFGCLGRYARQIVEYRTNDHSEAKQIWWLNARKRCDEVLIALRDDPSILNWKVEEILYFYAKLELPLAYPTGIVSNSNVGRFIAG